MKLFRMQDFCALVLTILLTLIFTTTTFAQDDNQELHAKFAYIYELPNLLPVENALNQITAQGSFRNNSNAVPLSFSLKLLGSGLIDKNLKDRINDFPGKNRLYDQDITASIFYQRKFESKDLYLFVGYQYKNMQYGNFPKEALNLVLYGNKMFEDQSVDLSGINFEYMLYNQYSIGIGKKENKFYTGVMLSFLQGYSDVQVKTKRGSIYTAPYGEYLDLDYDLSLNLSHEGAPNFFKPLGLGFSGDIHFSYEFSKGMLLFDAKDLGFIRWGNQSINYAKDTSFQFEGLLVIDNILNLNLNADNLLNLDSLQTNLIGAKKNKIYNTILPASFQLAYALPLKIKSTPIQLTVGVNTRILKNYYIMGFAKSSFFLPKNLVTSVSISGGGYSLFNLGWDFGYYSRNIDFMIGSHNLIGLFAANAYPSSSMNLRFAYKF